MQTGWLENDGPRKFHNDDDNDDDDDDDIIGLPCRCLLWRWRASLWASPWGWCSTYRERPETGGRARASLLPAVFISYTITPVDDTTTTMPQATRVFENYLNSRYFDGWEHKGIMSTFWRNWDFDTLVPYHSRISKFLQLCRVTNARRYEFINSENEVGEVCNQACIFVCVCQQNYCRSNQPISLKIRHKNRS